MAQAGSTCTNPAFLGNITTGYIRININYPDTIQWFSFISDSLNIGLTIESVVQNATQVKIKEFKLSNSGCTSQTSNGIRSFPGSTKEILSFSKGNKSDTVVFALTRWYDSSCGSCDSIADSLIVKLFDRGSSSCTASECGNLVSNPGFESHDTFITGFEGNFYFLSNDCWANAMGDPHYFHSGFGTSSPQNYQPGNIVWQAENYSVIGNTINPTPFPAPNNGFAGFEIYPSDRDIIRGSLSQPLTSGTTYYVSYLVSAGRNCSVYYDHLDLYFSTASTYTTTSPDLMSGDVTSGAGWQFVTGLFTGNSEMYFYLGNVGNNILSSGTSGVGSTPMIYGFVDNIFVAPFVLDLGPDIYCESTALIGGDCYFPGALYTWTNVSTNTVISSGVGEAYSSLGVSVSSSTIFQLTISPDPNNPGVNAISDQIIINPGLGTISLTANPSTISNGGTTVLTANTPPGSSNTYSFYYNNSGTLVLIGSANQTTKTTIAGPYTLGSLPGTIEFCVVITNSEGCIDTACAEVLVEEDPCASVNFTFPTNGRFSSFLSANPGFTGTTSALYPGYTIYSGYTILIENNFTFNVSYTLFDHCTFYLDPGVTALIDIPSTNGINRFQNSAFLPCTKMWQKIELTEDEEVIFENCFITQGEYGVQLDENSISAFLSNYFVENQIDVYGINIGLNQDFRVLKFYDNRFLGIGSFVPYYTTPNTMWDWNRPASGIYLEDIAGAQIGSNFFGENYFSHLFNGIHIRNCSGIVIENCRFEDIQKRQFYALQGTSSPYYLPSPLTTNPTGFTVAYPGDGAAIFAYGNRLTGNNTNLRVFNGPSQSFSGTPTFLNCWHSISTIGADIQAIGLSSDFIGDSETLFQTNPISHQAFKIETPPINFVLEDNTIRSRWHGIHIRASNPANGATIRNNEIFITGNRSSLGYVPTAGNAGVGINLSGPSSFVHTIDNNHIWVRDRALRGISLNSVDGNVLSNNVIQEQKTIAEQNYSGISNNFFGIRLDASEDNLLNCNIVSALNLANTNQRAYHLNGFCDDNRMECNFSDKTAVGFLFRGQNLNTEWVGSNLGTHTYSLWLNNTTSGANDAVFGVQGTTTQFNGNYWLNPGTDWAKNDNTLPFGSEIYVDAVEVQGTSHFFPANTTVQFQNPSSGSTYSCSGCGSQALTNLPEQEEMELLIELNPDEPFADEVLYRNKDFVFSKIELSNDSIDWSERLSTFADSSRSTNLERFRFINDRQKEILNLTESERTTIGTIYNNLRPLWEQYHHNVLNGLKDSSLVQQIVTNNNLLASVYGSINQNKQLKRFQLSQILNQTNAENLQEENALEIARILKTYFYHGGVNPFENEKSVLLQIANQCPLTGGKAVYHARTLYEMLDPGYVFDADSQNCIGITNSRIAAIEQKKLESNMVKQMDTRTEIKIFPNPTANIVQISAVGINLGNFGIYDVSGRKIQEGTFINNNELSVEHLRAGTYLLVVSDADGQTYHSNFIKVDAEE